MEVAKSCGSLVSLNIKHCYNISREVLLQLIATTGDSLKQLNLKEIPAVDDEVLLEVDLFSYLFLLSIRLSDVYVCVSASGGVGCCLGTRT